MFVLYKSQSHHRKQRRRRRNGKHRVKTELCYKCFEKGHLRRECMNRKREGEGVNHVNVLKAVEKKKGEPLMIRSVRDYAQ